MCGCFLDVGGQKRHIYSVSIASVPRILINPYLPFCPSRCRCTCLICREYVEVLGELAAGAPIPRKRSTCAKFTDADQIGINTALPRTLTYAENQRGVSSRKERRTAWVDSLRCRGSSSRCVARRLPVFPRTDRSPANDGPRGHGCRKREPHMVGREGLSQLPMRHLPAYALHKHGAYPL